METNRPSPRSAVFEGHLDSPVVSLPPPPPRGTQESYQLRRNVNPPPVLTTSLPLHSPRGLLSTPMTTTSLSSPFTQPSAHVHSAVEGPSSRGVSPAAHRMPNNYNVPYDPRDWSSGTQRIDPARRIQRLEDGLDSPPPPYSVPATEHHERRRATSNAVSIADSDSTLTSPLATGLLSRSRSAAPNEVNHSGQTGAFYAPPPPPRASTTRVINRQDHRVVSVNYDATPQIILPPAARRAASAGPATNGAASPAQPIPPNSIRSPSGQRSWQPGMPLPGPPPGPPPASVRSQSASSASDRATNEIHSARPRPLRLALRESNLGPIPATPANWQDEPSPNPKSRSGPPAELRIDTSRRQGTDNTDAAHEPISSAPNSSGLTRKSAVRDTSGAGLLERRTRSRPTSMILSPETGADLSALSMQTNPWADALIQSAASSRQNENGVLSPDTIRSRNNSSTSYDQVRAPETGTTRGSSMSHTPPASPPVPQPQARRRLRPQAASVPPIQTKVLPTPPLSQKAPHSAASVQAFGGTSTVFSPEDTDEFIVEALRRHKDFLEKERQAESDLDRLNLFMDFVREECSIRRDRYASTFAAGQFDVAAAQESIFADNRQRRASARESELTSGSATASPPPLSGNAPNRPETMWWKDYRPALSPIASGDNDEMSSRGRAPSRWWESQTGSRTDENNGPVQRSKRESKYMSLSKHLLTMDPVYEQSTMPDFPQASSSAYPDEKANPETFGFYDDSAYNPPRSSKANSSMLLDISRFITLPPPYPRHYPAVANSHPDLADFRVAVRTFSDLSDVRNRKSRQKVSVDALRVDRQQKISDSRKMFKANIREQINDGSITFAEAAEAEEALKAEEHEVEKRGLQAEFDTLQDVVINPLHDVLNGRVTQLTDIIQKIQRDLFTNLENPDPDRPMQEGDDFPELLEKLTMLKWVFEAREQLHKELFDLLSQRNDAYKDIVVLPYRQANNQDKVRGTEDFFNKDAAARYATFCTESFERHAAFLQTIEENTRRGVELQSSAFWDIAPVLLDLLQSLPQNLERLAIQIPDDEYAENPSYFKHPQQYLYTLLSHAEKSTYQYIESQVNLQCLVHEVKTSHLSALYRLREAQDSSTTAKADAGRRKLQEESALTSELKNRAAMIEEQWQDALGGQLQDTRDRVKRILQDKGVWEQVEDVE